MSGSTVVIGPPDGNMHEYIQSLKKLKEYKIQYIAPGHGSNIYQPIEAIDWIINHRLKREEKVLDKIIQLKNANLDRLVKSVYDDVDAALHPIAKASLEAHLIKLELEKKVLKNKDEWIYSEES
jgi:glyoxylase-like metal-dependent hydrolase (beta-lactamase superfamily II)